MPDWSLLGWEITAGGAIAACLAVAGFFPPFRKYALMAAAAVGVVLGIYRKGYKEGEARKKKEWDNAIERDVQKGSDARAAAERDVAAGGVRDTEWDRSKGRM